MQPLGGAGSADIRSPDPQLGNILQGRWDPRGSLPRPSSLHDEHFGTSEDTVGSGDYGNLGLCRVSSRHATCSWVVCIKLPLQTCGKPTCISAFIISNLLNHQRCSAFHQFLIVNRAFCPRLDTAQCLGISRSPPHQCIAGVCSRLYIARCSGDHRRWQLSCTGRSLRPSYFKRYPQSPKRSTNKVAVSAAQKLPKARTASCLEPSRSAQPR